MHTCCEAKTQRGAARNFVERGHSNVRIQRPQLPRLRRSTAAARSFEAFQNFTGPKTAIASSACHCQETLCSAIYNTVECRYRRANNSRTPLSDRSQTGRTLELPPLHRSLPAIVALGIVCWRVPICAYVVHERRSAKRPCLETSEGAPEQNQAAASFLLWSFSRGPKNNNGHYVHIWPRTSGRRAGERSFISVTTWRRAARGTPPPAP